MESKDNALEVSDPALLTPFEAKQDELLAEFMQEIEIWQSEVEGTPTEQDLDRLRDIYGFSRARINNLLISAHQQDDDLKRAVALQKLDPNHLPEEARWIKIDEPGYYEISVSFDAVLADKRIEELIVKERQLAWNEGYEDGLYAQDYE